jgi:hypothetical protein
MLFSRILLGLLGLMFLGFGAAFLARPSQMGQMVDIELTQPTGRMEIRAFYGGLEIGLGGFLLVCAIAGAWIQPSLVIAGLACAGPALGRVVGLLVDGKPRPVIYGILAFEIGCSVLVAIALALEWTRSRG